MPPYFTGIFSKRGNFVTSCLHPWMKNNFQKGPTLILLHSERPKLYAILAFLSAIGLKGKGADSIL